MSQRRSYVFAADGSIIWDIIGADSEGDGAGEDGDEDEILDDDEDGNDDGDEGDDDGEETVESLKSQLAEMTEKYERTFRRMQRADRAKTLANKKLKDLEESKDGAAELAAANAKIADLEQKLAQAGGQDKTSIVHEEFRDSTEFSWHNPKLAFSLLNLDEVDVDDKGKVDKASLKDAMKDLAKDHPYLVKAKDDTGRGDEDEDEDEGEKPKASGQNFGGKRRKSKIDRVALSRKYPVLSTR